MTDQVQENESVTLDEAAQEQEFARLDELSAQTSDCIKRHCIYAAVGGLVPLPFVEMVASSTIQLRMIAGLCDIYGVRFSENAVKNAMGTLIATVLPASSVGYAARSLIRRVPVVGAVFSVVAMPTLAAACTYALGKVFAWHFAKGGTAMNFKAEEMKTCFKEQFEEGKRKASEFIKGAKKTGNAEVSAATAA